MRNSFKKIWLPVLLVGVAAFQSFGIDVSRTYRHTGSLYGPRLTDTLTSGTDTVHTVSDTPADSTEHPVDTIINPADTIRIPDSLQTTDPLKFRYYIALKDSLTRLIVRDSLIAAGDTLELTRLDSLYSKDSAEVAAARYQAWYNGLSKKEKKKADYEREYPILLARMDSIRHHKDSIKARKDSIRNSIPRILSTFALPDSMQYKRIVMWKHDRNFHNLDIQPFDTTFNYHYNDYPFMKEDVNASYLGVVGSPVQTLDWFKRDEEDGVIFYTPYRTYTYSPETLPMYNTKTPYTELAYWGTLFSNKEKEESNIKILTSQNILPELNLTLEYHRYGGNGILKREDTDNRTAQVSMNYLGKKYLMHTAYIYNKVDRSENGGLVDNTWIRDTTVDAREIDVFLKNASNKIKKHTVFLDQSLRIPLKRSGKKISRKEALLRQAVRDSIMTGGDSVAIANLLAQEKAEQEMPAGPDTLNKNITSAFIGHSSEFSVFSKHYTDIIDASDEFGRQFYNNRFFIHPTKSSDSLRVLKFENRFFMRLQPWKADAIVSKIDVGIGDKMAKYYNFTPDSYLLNRKNTLLNSVYVYAGVQGQFKQYLQWNANGRYTFAGYEANDFGVDANLLFNAYPFRKHRKSPLSVRAHFETSLKEPDWYNQHLFTNHYKWDNDFKKTSVTKVQADIDIPLWKLNVSFAYGLLSNNIYYDTEGMVRQNGKPMSVMTASLYKDFKLWKFHFDHKILFQYSSNKDVLPLPMFSFNLRYYFQFDVVKNVMKMQIGANGLMNTKWYTPSYNPVLGVFHNQKDMQYTNGPFIDLFVNIQWKRACIFVKVQNINMGWPAKASDYFAAHNYIMPQRTFKFGIFWPFYIQPRKNGSVQGTGSAMRGEAANTRR